VKKDMAKLAKGEAPSLGLAQPQYEELIKIGEARKTALDE